MLSIGPHPPDAIEYKSVVYGQSASLSCTVPGRAGLPIVFLAWKRNSAVNVPLEPVLQELDTVPFLSKSFTNATYDDSGEYVCILLTYYPRRANIIKRVNVTVRGQLNSCSDCAFYLIHSGAPAIPQLLEGDVFSPGGGPSLVGEVRWASPSFDGNSEVTGYNLRWRLSKNAVWNYEKIPSTTKQNARVEICSHSEGDCGEHGFFQFAVEAINDYGRSGWCTARTVDVLLGRLLCCSRRHLGVFLF